MSLVEFLVQSSTIDFYPTKNDLSYITHWLQQNQNRLVLLLEGLDQYQFALEANNSPADFKTKKSPKIWLSDLIARNILSGCKLYVTSRPLSFLKLSGDLQPTTSLSLYDVQQDKLSEFLKFHFPQSSEYILNTLKENDVLEMAKHPMLIYLIAKTLVDGDIDTTDISLYQLLLNLFEKFHCCTNVSGTRKPNFQAVMRKIEEICYKMIETDQYALTTEMLRDYAPITLKDFEDVLTVDAGSKAGTSYQVDENEKVLVFNHQLLIVCYFLLSTYTNYFIIISFKKLLKFIIVKAILNNKVFY